MLAARLPELRAAASTSSTTKAVLDFPTGYETGQVRSITAPTGDLFAAWVDKFRSAGPAATIAGSDGRGAGTRHPRRQTTASARPPVHGRPVTPDPRRRFAPGRLLGQPRTRSATPPGTG